MYSGGDDIGALVADIGTFSARIGYAGEDYPRVSIPSNVGVMTEDEPKDATKLKKYNMDIHNCRDNMALTSIMSSSNNQVSITNWDALEELWEHSMNNLLQIDCKETPILFAEKSCNATENRHRTCELLFEHCNVPAAFLAKDATLACYACGRTTGMTVDVGYSGTVLTPVIDGWVESKGVNRSVVGGRAMDIYMNALLRSNFPDISIQPTYAAKTLSMPSVFSKPSALQKIHPTYEYYYKCEVGRQVIESIAKTADDAAALASLNGPTSLPTNISTPPFELPDGTQITTAAPELRYQPSEVLMSNVPTPWETFDDNVGDSLWTTDAECLNYLKYCQNKSADTYSFPYTALDNPLADSSSRPIQRPLKIRKSESLLPSAQLVSGLSGRGIPDAIIDSVMRCEIDAQHTLVNNLVVCGGGCSIEGLPERLRLEVEQRLLSSHSLLSSRVKQVSLGVSERSVSSWLGGSLLASLGAFHEMWISKQEYDEMGSFVVDKKCP